jgi:hypothetical protein
MEDKKYLDDFRMLSPPEKELVKRGLITIYWQCQKCRQYQEKYNLDVQDVNCGSEKREADYREMCAAKDVVLGNIGHLTGSELYASLLKEFNNLGEMHFSCKDGSAITYISGLKDEILRNMDGNNAADCKSYNETDNRKNKETLQGYV